MSELVIAAVLYAIGLIAFPYLLLREESKRNHLLLDGATYVVAAILLVIAPHAGVDLERDTAVTLFIYVKLFTVALSFVYAVRKQQLRDDPFLLALFAMVIQLLLFIPATRIAINGDETYYLTITKSIAEDFDLDLRNQYATSGLKPQLGDPTGADGQQYSRHEPFLSLLMVPGYLIAGNAGAVATIFLFGFLFLRALLFLLDEEQFSRESRVITFFFVAFGAPVLFYSMRIWPEVPGAYFLTASLISLRRDRKRGLLIALAALSLLKLRFVLIAVPLVIFSYRRLSGKATIAAIALLVSTLPFLVAYFATGNPLMVHESSELVSLSATAYARGFFGLMLDGQQGLLFVAPLFFIGLITAFGARRLSDSLILGALAALPYLLLLFPRAEWHGGWSPPLRYIVVFTPLFAIAAAVAIERLSRSLVIAAAIATAAFAVHGVVQPWRLFHIANGENAAGEYLSRLHMSDFSRLFPSFIRPNEAALVAAVGLIVLIAISLLGRRWPDARPGSSVVAFLTLFLAWAAVEGREAGRVVHLEDAHVEHRGGELYPHEFTVARFFYVGGWRFFPNDEVSFLARGGSSMLHYRSAAPARVTIGSRSYDLPTAVHLTDIPVQIEGTGRTVLRCVSGSLIIDQLKHD